MVQPRLSMSSNAGPCWQNNTCYPICGYAISDELETEQAPEPTGGWSIPRSLALLLLATALIVFLSKFLAGALKGSPKLLASRPTLLA